MKTQTKKIEKLREVYLSKARSRDEAVFQRGMQLAVFYLTDSDLDNFITYDDFIKDVIKKLK